MLDYKDYCEQSDKPTIHLFRQHSLGEFFGCLDLIYGLETYFPAAADLFPLPILQSNIYHNLAFEYYLINPALLN